jgi:hypothetical protein
MRPFSATRPSAASFAESASSSVASRSVLSPKGGDAEEGVEGARVLAAALFSRAARMTLLPLQDERGPLRIKTNTFACFCRPHHPSFLPTCNIIVYNSCLLQSISIYKMMKASPFATLAALLVLCTLVAAAPLCQPSSTRGSDGVSFPSLLVRRGLICTKMTPQEGDGPATTLDHAVGERQREAARRESLQPPPTRYKATNTTGKSFEDRLLEVNPQMDPHGPSLSRKTTRIKAPGDKKRTYSPAVNRE